jgi:hypothetical protein
MLLTCSISVDRSHGIEDPANRHDQPDQLLQSVSTSPSVLPEDTQRSRQDSHRTLPRPFRSHQQPVLSTLLSSQDRIHHLLLLPHEMHTPLLRLAVGILPTFVRVVTKIESGIVSRGKGALHSVDDDPFVPGEVDPEGSESNPEGR